MSELFNGTWSINPAESFVWDSALKRHVPDEVGHEVITLSIKDGVQDYEVLYGDSPQFRMGYTAAYDSAEWVSYSVREIIATGNDLKVEIEAFKRRIKAEGENERQLEVGKPYNLVRLVYIDDYTHYRISKSPIGKGPSILLRRLSENAKSYLTHVLDVNGIVHRIRKFDRIA